MGGSSLAPEVLRQSFGGERFHVLDTTHPAAIRALQAKLDLERTLFVSASKSGGDARDALAHRLLLEARAARAAVGRDHRPGSELERLARERELPRDLRGRADDRRPLLGAVAVRDRAGGAARRRPAAAARARAGDGRGLPPRRGQPGPRARPLARATAGRTAATRSACPTRTASASGSSSSSPSRPARRARASCRRRASRPTAPTARRRRSRLESPYELGQEFFRWEFGVAVAGSILGINPFDQPERAGGEGQDERGARRRRRRARREGSLDELLAPARARATTSASRRSSTRRRGRRGDRAARRARPRGDRLRRHARLRPALPALDRASCTRAARTPALFIQVVDDTGDELQIPGQPFGFARLIRAQAAGDFESLRSAAAASPASTWRISRCSSE